MHIQSLRKICLGGALTALLGFLSVYRPVVVTGHSMQPALQDRQVVFMNRWFQPASELHRGDIVVFRHENGLCVKRVLAVAGDNYKLAWFHNGFHDLLAGDLAQDKVSRMAVIRPDFVRIETLRVPKDEIFVVGDNRTCSCDSRDFGPVSLRQVIGRVETRPSTPKTLVAATRIAMAGIFHPSDGLTKMA